MVDLLPDAIIPGLYICRRSLDGTADIDGLMLEVFGCLLAGRRYV